MKKLIFTFSLLFFPFCSYAQGFDLVSGIGNEKQEENDNVVAEEKIETVKGEEIADDRGIFSFLNFSFVKKAISSDDEKEEPAEEKLSEEEKTTQTTDNTQKSAPPKKETPLEKMTRLADNGNLGSQLSLGYMYLYGQDGVNTDYSKAFHYYELAANQNSPIALNNLGSLYFNGIGTERNYQKAADLFLKAAQNGSDDAAVNLAFIYLSSDDTNQRHNNALKLLEESAKVGNNTAKFMLGYAYYKGYIKDQDYYKAFKLFKESADAKFDIAQYMLGYMYSKGYGISKNYGNAVKNFRLAVNQGNVPAMIELADIYSEGTMYPKNTTSAYVLYSIGAFFGADGADEKRDELEHLIPLETLLPAQASAENYREKPSELTSYIRQTYGPDVRVYIDKNIEKKLKKRKVKKSEATK